MIARINNISNINFTRTINTFVFLLLFFNSNSKANVEFSIKTSEVIVIHSKDIPRSEKEALIILPGLGDSKKGRKQQKKFFENYEFDLFIPDFKDKNSYVGTVEKFTQFYFNQKLTEYKKVHVFSYILGSWVINSFINENGAFNIYSIIYDRSPLQERAPKVVHERIPRIGKMVAGNLLKDLSELKYSPIDKPNIKIGIIVESKATPLIRNFKKTTMSYGPIDWHHLNFNQNYNDLIFSQLNHDEMYHRFDIIGEDILSFIKSAHFTKTGRREAYDWDPFEKYRE